LVAVTKIYGAPSWSVFYAFGWPGAVFKSNFDLFVKGQVFVHRHRAGALVVLHFVDVLSLWHFADLDWGQPAETTATSRAELGLVAAAK
jgi:hypothetical protein